MDRCLRLGVGLLCEGRGFGLIGGMNWQVVPIGVLGFFESAVGLA